MTLPDQPALPNPQTRPPSRNEVLLAGLPHVLMSLLIGLSKFMPADAALDFPLVANGLALLLVAFVAWVFFTAWRQDWPLWSASWYLYGSWIVLAVVSFALSRLSVDDPSRLTNLAFLAWILVCAAAYFRIYARDPVRGLLAVAFLFPLLGLLMIEFVPNPVEGTAAIAIGLVTGIGTAAIARTRRFRHALTVVIGVNLFSGLVISYLREFQALEIAEAGLPFAPSVTGAAQYLVFYLAVSLTVILLPFGVMRLSQLFRKAV